MTAQPLNLEGATIGAEIADCISVLFDAQARKRIADAYLNGWIVADDAMALLLSLDLIEHSPEAADAGR